MKNVLERVKFMAFAMLVLAVFAGYSSTSHAVRGCGYSDAGQLVDEELIYDRLPREPGPKRLIGKLSLYYSSVQGGVNIACLTHEGIADGVRTHTAVQMWRCGPGGDCENTDDYRYDIGNFKKIAGPVQIEGTRDRCVTVYGHIQIPRSDKVRIVVMDYAGCGVIVNNIRHDIAPVP